MRTKTVSVLLLAALSVVAVAAGCSNAQKDQALSTDIKSKMFSDPQVRAGSVDVTVKEGEATLSGEVPDDGARYRAYKIASDTPGVKHVVDKMIVQTAEIAPPAPPEAMPVRPPRDPETSSKPAKQTAKHHSKSDTRSASFKPDPDPVSAPAAPTPPDRPETPSAPAAAPAPLPPPPPPQPKRVEIPAGTPVRVQMVDTVDSSVNHAGEIFNATLVSPIVVDDQIVVPAGTNMEVKLTNAKSAGHMTGQSELALELVRMEFQGKSYSLASSDYQQKGSSRGKRTAETVGGGAVLGTLLGAVIGGGKGAAIGAATGAGAGGVAQGVTKGQQIRIPSETKLDFSLEQPVEVSYFPERNRSPRQ
jgi:hypothetical protein